MIANLTPIYSNLTIPMARSLQTAPGRMNPYEEADTVSHN